MQRIFLLLAVLALLLSACQAKLETAPEQDALAPNFSLTDINGATVTLSDYRGKVILVNFWATWCPPCMLEMPSFQAVYERYAGDLVVIGVDIGDPHLEVVNFVNQNGLEFPITIDQGMRVNNLYRVRSYPTSFLVDREGVIQVVHMGLMTDRQLAEYLAEMGLE